MPWRRSQKASAGPAMLDPEMRTFMRTMYAHLASTSMERGRCDRTPAMKQNTASQRVAAALRARIRSGALAPGAPAPSARQIVREYGVALATAAKVLGM